MAEGSGGMQERRRRGRRGREEAKWKTGSQKAEYENFSDKIPIFCLLLSFMSFQFTLGLTKKLSSTKSSMPQPNIDMFPKRIEQLLSESPNDLLHASGFKHINPVTDTYLFQQVSVA
jgi:hypothetical protein